MIYTYNRAIPLEQVLHTAPTAQDYLTTSQTSSTLVRRGFFIFIFPYPSTAAYVLLLLMGGAFDKYAIDGMPTTISDLVLCTDFSLRRHVVKDPCGLVWLCQIDLGSVSLQVKWKTELQR